LSVRDLGDDRTSRVGWGLRLSVGDLGDNRANGASWGLRLAIRDLGDNGASWSLRLAIRDLGDNRANGAGWGLRLTIRDLGDDSSRGLRLTIRDLADNSSRGLRLSVGDLSDCSNTGSRWLAVRGLANRARRAAGDGIDQDCLAVRSPIAVIQVVEVSADALIEDVGSTEGERAIVAEGEASGIDGSGLRRVVELELEVGGNISSAFLGIGELPTSQREDKAARVTTGTLVDITLQDLAFGRSDLEGASIVGRAACRRGRTGRDVTSHSLRGSVGRSGESSKSECSLHDCKANEV